MSTDGPELHDFSRLDAHMAARRRATVLHSLWRPLLAGAVASLAVSAAIFVVLPKVTVRDYEVPKVSYRDVTVDHVVPHDVTVNNLIPHDVPIEIPRIVPPPPSAEARTPAEQRFAETPGWRGAIVRGRILRELGLGFVMATDHGEQSFAPAKVGASGEVEADGSMKDLVADFIGDLAFCSPSPSGLYRCVALHGGKEVVIPEVATGGAAL